MSQMFLEVHDNNPMMSLAERVDVTDFVQAEMWILELIRKDKDIKYIKLFLGSPPPVNIVDHTSVLLKEWCIVNGAFIQISNNDNEDCH